MWKNESHQYTDDKECPKTDTSLKRKNTLKRERVLIQRGRRDSNQLEMKELRDTLNNCHRSQEKAVFKKC